MALWLVRSGKFGEFESKFLAENKIYLNWEKLNIDLKSIPNREEMFKAFQEVYPNEKKNAIRNFVGQVWPFAHEIQPADWIVMPSKQSPTVHFAEVKGKYNYHPDAAPRLYHSIDVNWFAKDIPRTRFDQDILYSFGAFMTVCRIQRNHAEERIRAMAKNNWKAPVFTQQEQLSILSNDSEGNSMIVDIEQPSRDQLAKFIERKFKGHRMAVLIEAILKANGYHTHRSPDGPDKGVDILAGKDSLGFGSPKICVQVKTTDEAVDRPTLDQLIGVMRNMNADYGLLVSWSGFKSSVIKETASQFFRVRIWNQDDVIRELFELYDKLDEDIKAEIPLKRIYVLSLVTDTQDESPT